MRMKTIKFRNSLVTRLMLSVAVVTIVIFTIGIFITVQLAQRGLEKQGKNQIAIQKANLENQIEQATEQLVEKLQPQLNMLAQLAKTPLIYRATGVIADNSEDPATTLKYTSCFQLENRSSINLCIENLANKNLIRTLTSTNKSNITIAINTLLANQDLLSIYIEDWDEGLYSGFMKSKNGNIEKLNSLSELPSEFPHIKREILDDEEYIGKVVFVYTLKRIEKLKENATAQIAESKIFIQENIADQGKHITVNRIIEGLLFFVILTLAILVVSIKLLLRPIRKLKHSAEHLAQGDLETKVDTSRTDELGSLALSFLNMRDAIRKQIENLRLLLDGTKEIASASDKFTAMTEASNSILPKVPLKKKATVSIYFKEKVSTGEGGYSCFQFPVIIDPIPSLNLSTTKEIVHSFSSSLPSATEELLKGSESGCVLLQESLYVPIRLKDDVLGSIEIEGIDEHSFTKEDKGFIETLSHSLSLTLENITHLLELEKLVIERTQRLNDSLRQLEYQNTTLVASNRKLEDLNHTKEQILQKLNELQDTHLQSLETILSDLLQSSVIDTKESIRQAARKAHYVIEMLRPIVSLYFSEKAIQSKRLLLAENNKKQQIIAKMALGGTGIELDIVSDLDAGEKLLMDHKYDVICVNMDLISLVNAAHKYNPNIYSVFMTSEAAPSYLPILQQYPISNIVSRNEEDRTFTLKNILTTASKLLNQDLFGIEKYLNWGVEVRQHPIVHSSERNELIQKMEDYLKKLGVRRSILQKCVGVVEELLMNAIYDAPTNAQGQPLYNHLPRTEEVALKPEEQGIFRYACDGMLLGVSVEDPFGAFDRQTILDYLKSCYGGYAGTLQKEKNKGGAGRGLFQIMETSDLVVWNIKPKIKTEVIALFNLDPNVHKSEKTTSFHYFSG